jgi:spermidine synthase
MKIGYLYICVSVSGASVLAVEILGTRILGPFYGVSLFLWSALITVTLAALSVGYALGGRWADRGATVPRFGALLAGAGVWLLFVPWIQRPVLVLAEPLGLRLAVLVAALLLFFPPLMLLGMVSPYAIKLRTLSLDEVGRSAGNLYAISTVASVVAALLTGFLLVPHVGVTKLTTAIGVILIATSINGIAQRHKVSVKAAATTVLLIAGAAVIAVQPGESAVPEKGLISIEQSPYGELRVIDHQDSRYLLIDGGIHTEINTETGEAFSAYVDVIDLAKLFFEEPEKCLLVGLGGGSIVKRFSRDGWTIDAVEIDPAVTKLAYRYFGLDSTEAEVIHMDGRRFLDTTGRTYELIILDAFGSSSIPFHLVTREAFGLVASRLKPSGFLVLNTIAVGWDDVLVRSLTATLKTRFSHVRALPIVEPPYEVGNVVLIASERPIELPFELPAPEDRFSAEYNRVHAWDNRFEPDMRGAPVLTDDRNPVDLWAEAINLAVRRDLHEHFGRMASW